MARHGRQRKLGPILLHLCLRHDLQPFAKDCLEHFFITVGMLVFGTKIANMEPYARLWWEAPRAWNPDLEAWKEAVARRVVMITNAPPVCESGKNPTGQPFRIGASLLDYRAQGFQYLHQKLRLADVLAADEHWDAVCPDLNRLDLNANQLHELKIRVLEAVDRAAPGATILPITGFRPTVMISVPPSENWPGGPSAFIARSWASSVLLFEHKGKFYLAFFAPEGGLVPRSVGTRKADADSAWTELADIIGELALLSEELDRSGVRAGTREHAERLRQVYDGRAPELMQRIEKLAGRPAKGSGGELTSPLSYEDFVVPQEVLNAGPITPSDLPEEFARLERSWEEAYAVQTTKAAATGGDEHCDSESECGEDDALFGDEDEEEEAFLVGLQLASQSYAASKLSDDRAGGRVDYSRRAQLAEHTKLRYRAFRNTGGTFDAMTAAEQVEQLAVARDEKGEEEVRKIHIAIIEVAMRLGAVPTRTRDELRRLSQDDFKDLLAAALPAFIIYRRTMSKRDDAILCYCIRCRMEFSLVLQHAEGGRFGGCVHPKLKGGEAKCPLAGGVGANAKKITEGVDFLPLVDGQAKIKVENDIFARFVADRDARLGSRASVRSALTAKLDCAMFIIEAAGRGEADAAWTHRHYGPLFQETLGTVGRGNLVGQVRIADEEELKSLRSSFDKLFGARMGAARKPIGKRLRFSPHE
ncbi:hypothetical protein DFJ74DRAFT_220733 [Hyaloraphidium curvatum]|nr:hypothetical protein DFJ74DRAFT_220733 [Hyaloraphidium curvatum]